MISPIKIKVAASQNENSRHCTDMGTDIGEPDLRLSARVRGIYHIYYLELKKTTGSLRESQDDWNADFDVNFLCYNARRDVAYGFQEAKGKIVEWINSLTSL